MKKVMIVLIAIILCGCAGMDAGQVLSLANTMATVTGVDTGALGTVANLAGGGGLGVGGLGGSGLGNATGLASGLTGDPMADLIIGTGVQLASQSIAADQQAAAAKQATRAQQATVVPTSTGSATKQTYTFNAAPLFANISDPVFANLILDRIDLNPNVKVYVRPSQVYFVIPLEVSKIEYYFYNDVFYRGTITVDKEEKIDRIYGFLTNAFGDANFKRISETPVAKIKYEDDTIFILISAIDPSTGFASYTLSNKELFNKSGSALGFTGNVLVDVAIYDGSQKAPHVLANNKTESNPVLPINNGLSVKPVGTEEVGFNPVTHETTYSNGNKYAATPKKSTYKYTAATAKANKDALNQANAAVQAAAASGGSVQAAVNFDAIFNRVMIDNINDPSSVNIFDIPTLTSMLQSCKSVIQSNQEMKALEPNVDFSAVEASEQELLSLIETTIANKKAGTTGSGPDTSLNDVYIPPTQDIGDVDGLLAKQPKNIKPSNNPNYDALASGPFVKVVTACGTQQPIASVVADGPCKSEIIEYTKIACRADWPSMTQTMKMYQCGVANSTGDRVAVNQHKVEETEWWMKQASGPEGLPNSTARSNVNTISSDIPKEVYSQLNDITPVRAPTTKCISDGHASCVDAR